MFNVWSGAIISNGLIAEILLSPTVNQAAGYAIQHMPVPVQSRDKLRGLCQEEHRLKIWG